MKTNSVYLKFFLLFIVLGFIQNDKARAQCVVGLPTSITTPCNTDTALIPRPTLLNTICIPGLVSIEPILPFQTIMYPMPGACDSVCFSKLNRSWRFTLSGGSQILYQDTICFTKADIASVLPVRDTVIYCSTPGSVDTSAAALGSPLKAQGIPCNLLQTAPTLIIWSSSARGCYKFTRQWNVTDWCVSPVVITAFSQTVEVRDTIKPSITVQEIIKISVQVDACTANVNFPKATVSDNCSLTSEIQVSIAVAGQTLNANGGLISGIPIGDHLAIYSANDGCGNISSDTLYLNVFDGIPPIAICKGSKTIQIPVSGYTVLPVSAFDDGSFDRCGGPITLKVRRFPWSYSTCRLTDTAVNKFDDLVKFCCGDANQEIMVVVRVYQGVLDPGPVSLDQYLNPFSECMVMVRVLEKNPPVVICPLDTTIDCRDIKAKSVKSLTAYGYPFIADACVDSIWIDSIPTIDACNKGKIVRKIYVRDKAGNIASCSQNIFVINKYPFNGDDPADLVWPADRTYLICSANTSTANTGVPVINDFSCSNVAFRSEDETYEFAPGACKKILRKWTAIDWCQVSSSNAYAGKWTHTQKIIVMDTAKPVLTVPVAFTVNNMDSVCGPASVTVPLPTATDCTPAASLEWSYTLDLFSDGINLILGTGRNASQLMPNGIHTLEFSVNDKCGNITKGVTIITVRDSKKPTPFVIHGLATDLALMNGAGMSRVNARQFIVPNSANDNCTPYGLLKFSYSASLSDSIRIFTCDSIGLRNVKIWVTDEASNQDYASTYILIQNNMAACPGLSPSAIRTAGIEGSIKTEWGSMVEQVDLKIMNGSNELPEVIAPGGHYKVNALTLGQSYELIPKKNLNPQNGISTVDLIMIQKHVLGLQNLGSAYKMIAADIDHNKDINGVDLIELRKMILGIYKEFPANNSWRFIDANYQFKSTTTALDEKFNEKYMIPDLKNPMQINFVGVKIGDVNESSISSELDQLEIRNNLKSIIQLNEQSFSTGDLVKIPVFLDQEFNFTGFQMAWQIENLEFVTIQSKFMTDNSIHTLYDKGLLKVIAHPGINTILPLNDPLFTLVLKANQNGTLNNSLRLNSKQLLPELYNDQLQTIDLGLNWKTKSHNSFVLQNNRPNPFNDQTNIPFIMPQAGTVSLQIIDLNGRIVYIRRGIANEGLNEWIVQRNQLPFPGIYYYRVESNWGLQTKRMLILE